MKEVFLFGLLSLNRSNLSDFSYFSYPWMACRASLHRVTLPIIKMERSRSCRHQLQGGGVCRQHEGGDYGAVSTNLREVPCDANMKERVMTPLLPTLRRSLASPTWRRRLWRRRYQLEGGGVRCQYEGECYDIVSTNLKEEACVVADANPKEELDNFNMKAPALSSLT